MTNIIEKNEHFKESNPTHHEQDELSPNTENFDIDAFVHTSTTHYGNPVATSSHDGIDMEALGSVVNKTQTAGKKLSRQEKKQAKKELATKRKESRKKYVSVKSQLKDRDKELSDKNSRLSQETSNREECS